MDNVSELPDDTLSFILSTLTIKEAARTSILSRRWRSLWKTSMASSPSPGVDVLISGTPNSNNKFGDCLPIASCENLDEPTWCLADEKLKFIGYVDQILHVDHNSVKNSFRLRFYFQKDFVIRFDLEKDSVHHIDQCMNIAITQLKDCAHHIDQWIEMAIALRCQNHDTVLSHFVTRREIYHDEHLSYYLFPRSTQRIGSSEIYLLPKDCSVRSLCSNGFKHLSYYLFPRSTQRIGSPENYLLPKDCSVRSLCSNGFKHLSYYLFPRSTQRIGSPENYLLPKDCSVRSLCSNGFISLLDLRLKYASINRDGIIALLSGCPNLEKLLLRNCEGLVTLEVSGSSLKLKHLTVICCLDLTKIKIDAKNLTRFQYAGESVDFALTHVPQLSSVILRTEISFSDGTLSYVLGKLSRDVPKLESLLFSAVPIEEKNICRQLPLFANLKTLVLLVRTFRETCGVTMWGFIPLLQASPCIRRLEIHWSAWSLPDKQEGLMERPCDSLPHLHLEEIILSGFKGTCHDIEFASYFLNNITSLKRMSIFDDELYYEVDTAAMDKISVKALAETAATCKDNKTEGGGAWDKLAHLARPGVQLLIA